MEVTEEQKRLAFKQVVYIAHNGCSKFKCKYCSMNKICDHFPTHSQFYANQMILMARSQEAK